MPKSHVDKLSKDDVKRHFPEKNGGKGDLRYRGRRSSHVVAEENKNYRDNFDKIDWSKK